MNISKTYLSIVFLMISCYICNAQTSHIDTLKILLQKPSTAIIDVRTIEEFEDGHIEQSINIPLNQITDSINFLKQYKDIIIICRSGNRSGKAKTILEERYEFNNLYNGGGWKSLAEIINMDK
jgi:phage shock protein E